VFLCKTLEAAVEAAEYVLGQNEWGKYGEVWEGG
jgi:hypothetical protein